MIFIVSISAAALLVLARARDGGSCSGKLDHQMFPFHLQMRHRSQYVAAFVTKKLKLTLEMGKFNTFAISVFMRGVSLSQS